MGQLNLHSRLLQADSIILISHRVTDDYSIKPPPEVRDSQIIEMPGLKIPFLMNGAINPSIIIEKLRLPINQFNYLARILTRPVNLKFETVHDCDEPRHAILIYSKNKLEFIDLCFTCQKVHTSKNINLVESQFDASKWKEIKNFFKKLGLTKALND